MTPESKRLSLRRRSHRCRKTCGDALRDTWRPEIRRGISSSQVVVAPPFAARCSPTSSGRSGLCTAGFTVDDVDSRVLARVVSERTRERFRNAIIDGINAGLAAVINMGVTEGFDADAIAEAIDADSEIAEGLNRLVEESVEEQIGDANADAAEA